MASSTIAFGTVYAVYVVAYLSRKNYGFWLSSLISSENVDPSKASVFGSIMETSYGASKLVAGPVADSVNPVWVLSAGLAISGACNLLMFQSLPKISSTDSALWGLNGFVQAFLWPALALVFLRHFRSHPLKGTLYSVLSTSQNVGSSLVPVLLSRTVEKFGWRVGALTVPGSLAIALGLSVPALLGINSDDDSTSAKLRTPSRSVRNVLCSKNTWCLGLGYAFLQFVRVSVVDWALVLDVQNASDSLVLIELGGLVGGLCSGLISDKIFEGRRVPWMSLSCLLAAISIYVASVSQNELVAGVGHFSYGFASFGPHMLVGLCARELFPNAPSTAGSAAKSIAQVGAAAAGVPFALLLETFSDGISYLLWTTSLVCASAAFWMVNERAADR